MQLSPKALSIWAKSNRDDSSLWHPLIAHMLDVAACALAILELEPESTRKLYQADFGFSSWNETVAWLIALIALHDLGKCSPSFINLWILGAERVEATGLLLGDKYARKRSSRYKKYENIKYIHHGYISQFALVDLLQGKGWKRSFALQIADAVGAHHGLRASFSELRQTRNSVDTGKGEWIEVRKALFDAIVSVLNCGAPSPVENLSAAGFMRLAALTSFTDWIGSNEMFFHFNASPGHLKTYYDERLKIARQALAQLGWYQRKVLKPKQNTFHHWFGFAPRPLQEQMVALTERAQNPMLLIIEAPMGEGKTEAAFDAHLRLQQRLGHRGMYVALPTQATGNAMFKRTLSFLQEMGHQHSLDLQLSHGASLLNTDFENLLSSGIYEGENHLLQEKSRVQAAEWFTHRKRALLSEYGVGTVDQALLSVLNVRHYFVRLWGLGNRTVVLDEVHAYDAYTSHLIFILVEWLRAMGSSVIIMSATLPPQTRHALIKAYGGKNEDIETVAYPRITRVQSEQVDSFAFEASRQQALWIRPLTPQSQAMAKHLVDLIKDGGCVACIVNTVARAQDIFRQLCEMKLEIDIDLFHARFPAAERSVREERILRKFGKPNAEGCNPDRPKQAILVATQVIEQSLDLDFDVMVTDLAPIDLLLQRAGRMHRHPIKQRWTYQDKAPTLYIAGLTLDRLPPRWGAPLFWNVIYDENVLQQTFFYLRQKLESDRPYFQLPQDIDLAVEEVYENQLDIPAWIHNADFLYGESLAEKQGMRFHAESISIHHPFDGSWEEPPTREKFDVEDPLVAEAFVAKTRLGDSLTLIPVKIIPQGFEVKNCSFNFNEKLSTEDAKHCFLQHVKVSSKTILNYYRNEEDLTSDIQRIMAHFQSSPLLRYCFPLVLSDNKTLIDTMELELSSELGLLIRKREK